MKNTVIFVACVIVIFLLASDSTPRSEVVPEPQFNQGTEEAAIRKVLEQFLAAFNRHDAEAYTSLMTETHENWEGTIKGRTAYKRRLTKHFTLQKSVKARILEEIGILPPARCSQNLHLRR